MSVFEKAPRILVVGSLVMDMVTSTEVFPEAGATVLGYQFTTAPGGKGANQAMQACLLGADVTMVGRVGTDAFGEVLTGTLEKAGVHTQHIMKDCEKSSAIGNITLTTQNGNVLNNRIIVVPGANMQIKPEDVAFLKDEIASYDMVMLQLEIPMEINHLVARCAKEAGVPVMLNPAPIAPLTDEFLHDLTYLSPNDTEAASLFAMKVRKDGEDFDEDNLAIIRKSMQERGLERLLMTMGDAGAMIVTQEGKIFAPSVKGIHVVDPTAAGDSFVAAFCTAKCLNFSDEDALRFANVVAAITVSGMGAMPSLPDLAKVMDFMRERQIHPDLLEKLEKR